MAKRRSKSRKPTGRKRIGEYLVEKNVISAEDIEVALEHQVRWGSRLGEALVTMGRVTEEEMYKWLARYLGLAYFRLEDLDHGELPRELVHLVSENEVEKHRVVPIQITRKQGKKRFIVATSEPLNFSFLDQLKFRSGAELLVMVSNEKAVDHFASRLFGKESSSPQFVQFEDYFTNWIDIENQEADEESTIPYTRDERNKIDR